jgi:BON domain-containing protein
MTDRDLKQHVENALEWEPSFDAADIGVSVDGGVVTLRGDVGSHAAKSAAERVALRVYGVKAVANDLTVRLLTAFERNDTDIAQAAVTALIWNAAVPGNRITVTVSNAWLTLNGTLDWHAHMPVRRTEAEFPSTPRSSMSPPSARKNGRTRSSTASTRCLAIMCGSLNHVWLLEPLVRASGAKDELQPSCHDDAPGCRSFLRFFDRSVGTARGRGDYSPAGREKSASVDHRV